MWPKCLLIYIFLSLDLSFFRFFRSSVSSLFLSLWYYIKHSGRFLWFVFLSFCCCCCCCCFGLSVSLYLLSVSLSICFSLSAVCLFVSVYLNLPPTPIASYSRSAHIWVLPKHQCSTAQNQLCSSAAFISPSLIYSWLYFLNQRTHLVHFRVTLRSSKNRIMVYYSLDL